LTVILVDDEEKVLATSKTDVKGEYTFTAPGPEYNVVSRPLKSRFEC